MGCISLLLRSRHDIRVLRWPSALYHCSSDSFATDDGQIIGRLGIAPVKEKVNTALDALAMGYKENLVMTFMTWP